MDPKGYTCIYDWMLSFDLDIYETFILAVIHGFSQDGESSFAGTLRYLAGKTKCSRRKVLMALSKLVRLGLVIKTDKTVGGVHLCEYKVSPACMGSASDAPWGGACRALGGACDAPGGGACRAPIENLDKENINNTLSNARARKFEKPTLEAVRKYCMERGGRIDPVQFYDFYESKGWMVGKNAMKDWRAAVRTWERRRIEEQKAQQGGPRPARKESVLEHNLRTMDEMFGTDLHARAYGEKGGDIDEQ